MNFFDLHCDTVTRSLDEEQEIAEGKLCVTLEKARGIGIWCQIFAMFLDDSRQGAEAYAQYRRYADYFHSIIEKHSDRLAACRSATDIETAIAKRQCAAILSVENGAALGGNLANIEAMLTDGVRLMTLTWNGENELGYGSGDLRGLKPFGREAARELTRAGIVLDVSHLSDAGFDDVLALNDASVIASHSNLRAVCGHPRNLTDNQFRALAARDGLIGLNLHRPFLSQDGNSADEIDSIFRHVDRMLKLGGENSIAIGSDFDGAQMPGFCRDIAGIPQLHMRFVGQYGVTIADKIFHDNARRFFALAFA